MQVQPHTDLTQFVGRRVRIDHSRAAHITTATHGGESPFTSLHGGFGGMCVEDPHGTCRGGSTAYWHPYGTDLTVIEA